MTVIAEEIVNSTPFVSTYNFQVQIVIVVFDVATLWSDIAKIRICIFLNLRYTTLNRSVTSINIITDTIFLIMVKL